MDDSDTAMDCRVRVLVFSIRRSEEIKATLSKRAEIFSVTPLPEEGLMILVGILIVSFHDDHVSSVGECIVRLEFSECHSGACLCVHDNTIRCSYAIGRIYFRLASSSSITYPERAVGLAIFLSRILIHDELSSLYRLMGLCFCTLNFRIISVVDRNFAAPQHRRYSAHADH